MLYYYCYCYYLHIVGRTVFVKCGYSGIYISSIQTLCFEVLCRCTHCMLRFVPLTFTARLCCPSAPTQEVHKYIAKLVLGFLYFVWGHECRRFAWCKESEVVLAFKVAEFQIALGMAYWLVGNNPQAWPILFWDEWKNTRNRMEAETNNVFKLNRRNLFLVLEALLNDCAWRIHCTDGKGTSVWVGRIAVWHLRASSSL